MSKLKANELREMTVEELNTKLGDLKTEFFNLRFRRQRGSSEIPLSIRDIKRDIARVKTVLRERELNAAGK